MLPKILKNLIQFQSNFNSILEPTCKNKLWWDLFQIKKRKANFKILKLVFWFEMNSQISKNIFHFLNLIIELKNEKRKNFYLNLLWFTTDFKNQQSKFLNSIFDLKSKSEFQRILSFFNFLFWNWKMKNEKFSKFILFSNQKTNHTNWIEFQYSINLEMEKPFHFVVYFSNFV